MDENRAGQRPAKRTEIAEAAQERGATVADKHEAPQRRHAPDHDKG